MAYRIAPSGATSAGPVYLYGYSFALNSAKTVQSITLPNNRDVVVLAIDVSPTGSAAAARGEPGLESAARVLQLGPIGHARRYHAGRGDLLHDQRHRAHRQFRPVQPGHAGLDQLDHHPGSDRRGERLLEQRRERRDLHHRLARNDAGQRQPGRSRQRGRHRQYRHRPRDRGLDMDGYAYSATLLGTSLSWGGSSFTLGAAGVADAVSSTTIALPAGNDSTLNILATAVNGAQTGQSFVVTYTDGTTSTFKQNLSDWFYPQNFAGESQALKMAYRIAPSGATSAGPVYLYGYSFALNSAKTVQSITLPNNRNVVVFAVDLTP